MNFYGTEVVIFLEIGCILIYFIKLFCFSNFHIFHVSLVSFAMFPLSKKSHYKGINVFSDYSSNAHLNQGGRCNLIFIAYFPV